MLLTEVMGSIPDGDSDFSLFHARVMLVSSLFTLNDFFLRTMLLFLLTKVYSEDLNQHFASGEI